MLFPCMACMRPLRRQAWRADHAALQRADACWRRGDVLIIRTACSMAPPCLRCAGLSCGGPCCSSVWGAGTLSHEAEFAPTAPLTGSTLSHEAEFALSVGPEQLWPPAGQRVRRAAHPASAFSRETEYAPAGRGATFSRETEYVTTPCRPSKWLPRLQLRGGRRGGCWGGRWQLLGRQVTRQAACPAGVISRVTEFTLARQGVAFSRETEYATSPSRPLRSPPGPLRGSQHQRQGHQDRRH